MCLERLLAIIQRQPCEYLSIIYASYHYHNQGYVPPTLCCRSVPQLSTAIQQCPQSIREAH